MAEAQMQYSIVQYTAALQDLERALPQISEDQRQELLALVPAYRQRVQALRAALAAVSAPPPVIPVITKVENDAISILNVKRNVDDAKQRSQQIADDAMAKIKARSS